MQKSYNPLIDVLMPVYNAKDFLNEAIDSLLAQTYTNWILIVIDDASTDNSVEIVEAYKDNRIQLIKKSKNTGSYDTLNQGLKKAKGKYIAILDADDICHPERFQRQVHFLESSSEIGLCGTWVKTFGLGKEKIWKYPTKTEEIRCALLFHNCFAHSSVMIRRSILEKHNLLYNTARMAQDYDLWVRISEYTQTANIKTPLVYYRVYPHSKSALKRQEQHIAVDEIVNYQLQKLQVNFTANDLLFHSYFTYRKNQMPALSFSFLYRTFSWCYKLLKTNYSTQKYSQTTLVYTIFGIYATSLLRKQIDRILFLFKKISPTKSTSSLNLH